MTKWRAVRRRAAFTAEFLNMRDGKPSFSFWFFPWVAVACLLLVTAASAQPMQQNLVIRNATPGPAATPPPPPPPPPFTITTVLPAIDCKTPAGTVVATITNNSNMQGFTLTPDPTSAGSGGLSIANPNFAIQGMNIVVGPQGIVDCGERAWEMIVTAHP